MNFKVVARLLSFVCVVAILLFFSCGIIGCFFHLSSSSILKWIICICISWACYLFFQHISKNSPTKFSNRESLATVGLSWTLIVLLGTLPYLFFLKNCSFIDALFESASGFTSTGATVFQNLDAFDNGLMLYRCATQWIGGIGIVVFFILFIPFLGVGAKFLQKNEMSTRHSDINFCAMSNLAQKLLRIYIIISLACFILYWIGGMSFFDAICHMFATVSTGGFGTSDLNFKIFDSKFLRIVCTTFMAIGGMNFIFLIHLAQKNFKEAFANEECKVYLTILLSYGFLVTILLFLSRASVPAPNSFIDNLFNVTSVMTSTGFSCSNYDAWLPSCNVLFLTLTIMGGCTGSTAGGLKISRIIIAVKICLNQLRLAFHPNLVKPIFLNKRALDSDEISSTLTYIVLFSLVSFIGILIFVILQRDISFIGSVSSVCACLNNTGSGLQEVGPSGNYACLATSTKLFLSILMITGRVEFYAIAVLFIPKFWRKTF